MIRRRFLARAPVFGAAVRAVAAKVNTSAAVAITIDDFALSRAWPQTPSQLNRVLLDLLQKERLHVTLFVTASNVADRSARRLLQDWVDAGHVIGNHTYSHRSINAPNLGLRDFERDMLRAEQILQPFSTYERIFRFPALKEGNTVEKRDGMRAFLRRLGYRNGRVTIDASDWYYAERLQSCQRVRSGFDFIRFRVPYVEHIQDRSLYYDKLARQILRRSPKHTLLIHYSYLNGQFLGDVISMYRTMKWRLVSSSDAFSDPVFRLEPNTLPAGESLIWALAKQTGRYEDHLRYPGEDGSYEKPKLDQLSL